MTKFIAKLLLVAGLCGGALLGTSGEARAWTAVPISASWNVWGPSVTDFFVGWVTARARKATGPYRGQLNVTANSGTYTSSLSIWCTNGNSTLDKAGSNTTNGDITLNCPAGGVLTNAGGALQAN